MSAAFGDSTFFVALLIARDANHAKAKLLAQSFVRPVVTTEYILAEVANHLSGSKVGRDKFGQLLDDLKRGDHATVVESSHGLWSKGVDLYLQRPDKEWSLTDCISFVVMQEQGIHEALTADHHFVQAGFVALLEN